MIKMNSEILADKHETQSIEEFEIINHDDVTQVIKEDFVRKKSKLLFYKDRRIKLMESGRLYYFLGGPNGNLKEIIEK